MEKAMLPDISRIACHDMTFYMTHGHLLVNLGRSHRELRGTPPVDPCTLSQGSMIEEVWHLRRTNGFIVTLTCSIEGRVLAVSHHCRGTPERRA